MSSERSDKGTEQTQVHCWASMCQGSLCDNPLLTILLYPSCRGDRTKFTLPDSSQLGLVVTEESANPNPVWRKRWAQSASLRHVYSPWHQHAPRHSTMSLAHSLFQMCSFCKSHTHKVSSQSGLHCYSASLPRTDPSLPVFNTSLALVVNHTKCTVWVIWPCQCHCYKTHCISTYL